MIAITTTEKELIREKFPNVHIVRTMKGDSKRHHYYMTEERNAMKFLRSLRKRSVVRNKNGNPKKGA